MMIVFADDLTGAMDAGAPFGARGLTVKVWIDASRIALNDADNVDVTIVNLECRHLTPDAARETIDRAKYRLGTQTIDFLKIDSTLRGPLPAMLRAAAG